MGVRVSDGEYVALGDSVGENVGDSLGKVTGTKDSEGVGDTLGDSLGDVVGDSVAESAPPGVTVDVRGKGRVGNRGCGGGGGVAVPPNAC